MAEKKSYLKDRTARMIESDRDVKRWVNNLNSASAKRLYSEALCKFSEYCNLTPNQVVQRFNQKRRNNKKHLKNIFSMLNKAPLVNRANKNRYYTLNVYGSHHLLVYRMHHMVSLNLH